MQPVFITGGTGYIGKRLINLLLNEGFSVKALVRKQSVNKLPEGCSYVVANPFDEHSFAAEIPAGAIFIQLLGVAHPSPKKSAFFESIDLASVKASAEAAKLAGASHFIYLSVSQYPSEIMKAYQRVRAMGEAIITGTGIRSTFLRPWYVIGPGHYWPLLLLPLFSLLELIPATAKKARALRLVTLRQMLRALVYVVKHPPALKSGIIEIDQIRALGSVNLPAEKRHRLVIENHSIPAN